jgi:hypothetical protein
MLENQRIASQLRAIIEKAQDPSESTQRIQVITADLAPENRQKLWGWIRANDPLLAAKLKAIRALAKPLGLREILAIDFPKSRIILACQWYEDNRDRIQANLPIEVPREPSGISLYQANWDISYWIRKWRGGNLSMEDADYFICGQLDPLVAVFDDAEVMGSAA